MQATGVAFQATRKHISGPLIPDNSHGLYVRAAPRRPLRAGRTRLALLPPAASRRRRCRAGLRPAFPALTARPPPATR